MTNTPEGEDQALAQNPAFHLAVWKFVADARVGRADPGAEHLFEIARFLAGLWESTMTSLHQRMIGSSDDEARAYVTDLVAAQQALYGSLTASVVPPGAEDSET